MDESHKIINQFVLEKRKKAGLTQKQLAQKAGVGLRMIRALEQGGRKSFKTDTLNRILRLFGSCLGPIDLPRK